jgi:integrase
MAHISAYPEKRPDGRYRAVVRKAGYKTVSKIFPTQAAAKKWATTTEAQMDSRKYRDSDKSARDTVGSVFEKFRDEVCPGRKGGKWERNRINKFLRESAFMKLQIKQLHPSDLREWRKARVQQVAPQSVNREMNLLSAVFAYAMEEWDYVFNGGVNPVTEVARPEGGGVKYRRRRWEAHELDAFLKAASFDEDAAPAAGRDYVPYALLLGLETAMRPSEFCGAKVQDVKLDRRCIVLHEGETKNGSGREVPLSKRAIKIVATLIKDKRPDEAMIPITAGTLGAYYRELRAKAGLKDADLRFYDIKHESISRLAKKFANVLELSAVTGHKSLQSLKFYYNPTVNDLADKLG